MKNGSKIGGRSISTVLSAILKREHYVALASMMTRYDRPFEELGRYLLKSGQYPHRVRVRTPVGKVEIELYSHHDLLTVNEIFCRGDYRVPDSIRTVVDFGSNIGISALYFLTRNHDSRVMLVEPLASNIAKLKKTLAGFEDRYVLYPVAVGLEDGVVDFGIEETGRYGGIGTPTGRSLRVPCREVNGLIQEIAREHGLATIDLLKIDIEGYESKVVAALNPENRARISRIYAEIETSPPDVPGFHRTRYGPIQRWTQNTSAR